MQRSGLIVGLIAALTLTLAVGAAQGQNQTPLQLNKADHVTMIGNALPERMNHFGWFETLIHSRFPQKDLTVRNIGYAGDMLDSRLRVKNYGSQDDWLRRTNTDVIFAFFGFNESFEGKAGLDDFKNQLANFIDHVRNKQYNGESKPRLVLFSPIAAENQKSHDLPEASNNNRRLEMYTKAMQQVAAEHEAHFVNLFAPSKQLFQNHDKALTINSVHLDKWGYKQLAPVIDRRLFGTRNKSIDWQALAPLRQAVNKKNRLWFERYRVTDGYNVYGGRSSLSYEGISNREVMKREMEVLEQQVENRDKRVWAVAKDNTGYTVEDNNLPEMIDVPTNMPGDLPGGKHKFRGPKEAIKKMTLADGFEVNLFASEKQFPSLVNPVQMAFDTEGRLWVAAWATYPHWKPTTPMDDKLIILEDTNNDGQADKRTIFADGLSNPTGFEFWNGGVLVARAPYMLFLKDTDGDDKADVEKRFLSHISSGDTHHTANSFVFDPGGALYFSEGNFHRTQLETPHGPVLNKESALWRFRPDTFHASRYAPMDRFANAHGHVFNYWGQGFSWDATSAHPFHDTVISGHLPYPKRHPNAPKLYDKRTRPLPGTGILSSHHFPDKMQGDLLVLNNIGLRGIMQYDLKREGTSYTAEEREQVLIKSSDPNFRPVDVQMGPDGAIYFTDWQNPIIGHMQHHIRDPNRDQEHGRVYRITYKGRELSEPRKIDGASIEHLLSLLKDTANHVRYRAKIELSERDRKAVINAVDEWIESLDPNAPRYTHHLLEGLWVHQWHNTVDQKLLVKLLNVDEPKARAAAVRVLCYWRDRIDQPLSYLAKTVNDPNGLVRLETVRAASFFDDYRAVEIALQATDHKVDAEMNYLVEETVRGLEPVWREALHEGKPVANDQPQHLQRLVSRLDTSELLDIPDTPAVNQGLLTRSGVSLENRRAALEALAEARGTTPPEQLVNMVESGVLSGSAAGQSLALLKDYSQQQLKPLAARFEKLAKNAKSPDTRQGAMIALMIGRQDAAPAWNLARQHATDVRLFLDAVNQIESEKIRRSAYDIARQIIFSSNVLPGEESGDGYLRMGLYKPAPDNAKIETFADRSPRRTHVVSKISHKVKGSPGSSGDNYGLIFNSNLRIDKPGKYTFSLTSDDGSRLYINDQLVIDNDGAHAARTRTGSVELKPGRYPITVTFFERGGEQTLSLQWAGPGFSERALEGKALVYKPKAAIRQKAIRLLAALPVKPAKRFADLTRAVTETDSPVTAANAAATIEKKHRNAKHAMAIGKTLLNHGKDLSSEARGEDEFRSAIAFARELLAMQSNPKARKLDRDLAELVVKVIVIKGVKDKLLYDIEEFTVKPGQEVEIRFINPTEMPHNLLITKPGQMATIGKAAQQMAAKPNAYEKDFVPDTPEMKEKILWATGLLGSGERETLRFTAPKKPDDYPYVCTFPGHWRTMNGTMHVKKP